MDTLMYPASLVWPMGFSWSSFIAQSAMLDVCRCAGLTEDLVLCDTLPAPRSLRQAFALATDDIMVFHRGTLEESRRAMDRVDRAFVSHHVERHPLKDVTGASNATCIGIDVVDGIRLRASAIKLPLLILALCEVIFRGEAAPKTIEILLGHIQWFDLLARPLFSILDTLYASSRQEGQLTIRALEDVHLAELSLVMLAPFWQADLRRPWLRLITATDASVSYGFGLCVAPCTASKARALGRLSEKRGDYVRLSRGDPDDEEEKVRIGRPHKLGLRKSAFSTVVSAKRQHDAHAGSLEATGLQILLRWLLRSRKKHNHRVVALVDAKAVLCAASKGRTSAPSLRRDMRRIAALTLAGGFHMHYLYVPSEDNPADAPSRGVIRKIAKRSRKGVARKPARVKEAPDNFEQHIVDRWRMFVVKSGLFRRQ